MVSRGGKKRQKNNSNDKNHVKTYAYWQEKEKGGIK